MKIHDRRCRQLQIGDAHFGAAPDRLRTLLGSCVAITLWHPRRRLGGMCHSLLPEDAGGGSDPRHVDGAMRFFLRRLQAAGTAPAEYEAMIFGGGCMFVPPHETRGPDIGARNVAAARALLRAHGVAIRREHTSGRGHRDVIFDLASGRAWLRHVELQHPLREAA